VKNRSVLNPAVAHINEPVLAGRVEWLPFRFMHGDGCLLLCDGGCPLSRGDYGSLAIWPNIFSRVFLGQGVHLEVGSHSNALHAPIVSK
jgi:hypothetical protein